MTAPQMKGKKRMSQATPAQTDTKTTSSQPPPKSPVKCIQPGCKKISENEETATKDGWYLDQYGEWHCYQHRIRLN